MNLLKRKDKVEAFLKDSPGVRFSAQELGFELNLTTGQIRKTLAMVEGVDKEYIWLNGRMRLFYIYKENGRSI